MQSLVVRQGLDLVFVQADTIQPHSVTSDGFRAPNVRLFDSGLLDGPAVETVPGVERLGPGTYPFHCKIHQQMKGTLVVV